MGLLDLLQGDDDRRDFSDFADRFERGAPHEHYDEHEAHDRYRRVSQHLSPEEFEDASYRTLERMHPQERRELGRMMRSRARERGYDWDDDEDRYEDPRQLSGMMGRVEQRSPGGLGDLLGMGGGGGGMGGVGGMLGGGGGGGMLPKVLMGGIAAMAARQVMGGR